MKASNVIIKHDFRDGDEIDEKRMFLPGLVVGFECPNCG